MSRQPIECCICGEEFVPFGRQTMCPKCKDICYHNNRRKGSASSYEKMDNNNAYELRIKANAIRRAKHNENIIGEGYAERQIADTLSRVEKIKTEI